MSSSTPPDDAGIGLFSGQGDGDAPEPRRPRKRRGPKILLISVVSVLVLALIAAGLYAYSVDRSVRENIRRAANLPPETPTAEGQKPRPKKPSGDKSLNYVLMGSDSRNPESEKGRSDTLMILHLDADRKSAYIVSFPRDMYVDIPGHGKNKINSAYALGGSPLAVRTVEELLDLRMDHVALVSLAGFIDITNQLGGVTVTNKQEFSSHGFHYPKGEITVSGKRAMWFVRERKSLSGGDLDRAANQRKVVQAIIAEGLSGDTIANPRKFTGFVSGVAENITVDDRLTDSKMRKIALSIRMDPRDVKQVQAPLAGYDEIHGVGSVDVVDQQKLNALAEAMRKDELADHLAKNRK